MSENKYIKKNQIGNISLIIAFSGFLVLELLYKFFKIKGILFKILLSGFEASTVGAFADWFAISALYYRIPIPLIGRHTNIILRNRKKLEDGIVKVVLNEWLSKDIIKEKLENTNIILLISNTLLESSKKTIFEDLKIYEKSIKSRIFEMLVEFLEKGVNDEELKKSLVKTIDRVLDEKSISRKFFIDIGKKFNLIDSEKISLRVLESLKNELKKAKNNSSSVLGRMLEEIIEKFWKNLQETFKEEFAKIKNDPKRLEEVNKYLRKVLEAIIEEYHPKIGDMVKSSLKRLSDEELVEFVKQKIDYDLQYIRFNGAVVGGIVGVILELIKIFFHVI